MPYPQDQIDQAIANAKETFNVHKDFSHYEGYILMTSGKEDKISKKRQIDRGETEGFISVTMALKLGNKK